MEINLCCIFKKTLIHTHPARLAMKNLWSVYIVLLLPAGCVSYGASATLSIHTVAPVEKGDENCRTGPFTGLPISSALGGDQLLLICAHATPSDTFSVPMWTVTPGGELRAKKVNEKSPAEAGGVDPDSGTGKATTAAVGNCSRPA